MKATFFLALVSVVSAAAINAASPETPVALYFMSNLVSGNQVIPLSVNGSGLITAQGKAVATGGKGGRAPSTIGLTDALNSQGSLAIAGNYLYAVNAGSNTVSVLAIDPKNPMNITLIGKPLSTGGDFPMSVVVNATLGLACVANTGTKSGIACYTVGKNGLLTPDGSAFRPLPLSPTQKNPPTGPFNTVSEVFFNQEGTALWTTVKGTPPNGSRGYFASFPITKGSVSTTETRSSPNRTAALFGSVALPEDKVFFADPSFGAGFLQIGIHGRATTLTNISIANQGATCWSTFSAATGLLYTSDDGANQIASFNPKTEKLVQVTKLANGNPSNIQILGAGMELYALSTGSENGPQHVVVLSPLANGAVISKQNFEVTGTNTNIDGLVALMG